MFKSVTTIIAGVVGATGLTVLSDLMNGKISMRPILGGFVIGAALLTLAFFAVPLASALALMLLITSILVNAPAVLGKVDI